MSLNYLSFSFLLNSLSFQIFLSPTSLKVLLLLWRRGSPGATGLVWIAGVRALLAPCWGSVLVSLLLCCVLQATWRLSLPSLQSLPPSSPRALRLQTHAPRHLAFFSEGEYRQSGCTANPSMEEPQLKPTFRFWAVLSQLVVTPAPII